MCEGLISVVINFRYLAYTAYSLICLENIHTKTVLISVKMPAHTVVISVAIN